MCVCVCVCLSVCLDFWASAMSRTILSRTIFEEQGEMDSEVAAFFTSYFLVASVTLLNVVVAVRLGEFGLRVWSLRLRVEG